MDRRSFLKVAMGSSIAMCSATECFGMFDRRNNKKFGKPNIVYLLVDDLGYGDVKCMNPESKIPTPNIDRLSKEGMMFTDAHANAAVCTPTRYGILTGRYCWRSRLKKGVINSHEKALIEPGRLTVGELLQRNGYTTAAIGKWHLGEDWVTKDGKTPAQNGLNVDYSKPYKNGATTKGFDYFFGNPGINMAPFSYMENDHTVGIPSVPVGDIGLKTPGYELAAVMPTLTKKAVEYIEHQAKQKKPFFLYFPMTAVHGPIVPSKEWQGKSGLTPYADFVMQTDWSVGQVLDALDRNELAKNTIVIFTSDNGCAPGEALALEKLGHKPSYIFRGYKLDLFEGGHHIPFIVRWPENVKAGSKCNDAICLTDFIATAADILDYKLPENAGEDSVSILPDMLGTAKGPLREATIYNTYSGSLAIHKDNWKLILNPWSGGWSQPPYGTDVSNLAPVQLYDIKKDIAETINLQDKYPDVVKDMTSLLQSYIKRGRSTPGKIQKNDGDLNSYIIFKP